jgi:hypothetical protein
MQILEESNLMSIIIGKIKESIEQVVDYDGRPTFKFDDNQEEEIDRIAEEVLKKPYREWMAKEKTKIRYNIAEDAKRTWNKIKQTTGQTSKIKPDEFKNHYEKNWSNNQRKLILMKTLTTS